MTAPNDRQEAAGPPMWLQILAYALVGILVVGSVLSVL